MDIKKQYICTVPFTNMELHDRANFMCCPSWLLKKLPSNVKCDTNLWNSEESQLIRKSVTDGSYKYCDENQCPYLSQLINFGNSGNIGPLTHISEVDLKIKKHIDEDNMVLDYGPEMIQLSFDRTCNYHCPSCRVSLYTADFKKIKEVESKIEEVVENYGKSITHLYITGSGDPFISVGFRNFLRNFDSTKFPNLNVIHLHTNASRWNKEMWETMKPIWNYVKSCEISIDAGTKETYENETRLGGNWDNLINNLNFISTLPQLKLVKTSFVVQTSNFKEMDIFLKLMKSIFKKKAQIFFGKITNWGTYGEEEFKNHKIWDPTHPKHLEFLNEFTKVHGDPQVFHNLQEFIPTKKTII